MSSSDSVSTLQLSSILLSSSVVHLISWQNNFTQWCLIFFKRKRWIQIFLFLFPVGDVVDVLKESMASFNIIQTTLNRIETELSQKPFFSFKGLSTICRTLSFLNLFNKKRFFSLLGTASIFEIDFGMFSLFDDDRIIKDRTTLQQGPSKISLSLWLFKSHCIKL
jgi:hypothetical protein